MEPAGLVAQLAEAPEKAMTLDKNAARAAEGGAGPHVIPGRRLLGYPEPLNVESLKALFPEFAAAMPASLDDFKRCLHDHRVREAADELPARRAPSSAKETEVTANRLSAEGPGGGK